MAYGFHPFVVVRTHGNDTSTLLHAFSTFEQAMLYARSKARDGSQIDVLDCSDPNNCIALAVAVGRTEEYVSQAGMTYLDNPVKRKKQKGSRAQPRALSAGAYPIFGFTDHPGFSIVAVDESGKKYPIESHPTFGQAMYFGRSFAPEAARRGQVIAVLGCLEGRCGVPLVSGVGTESEWYLPRSHAFAANPVPEGFMANPAGKNVTYTSQIDDLLSSAGSEAEELRDEMSNWRDSLEDHFSGTDKYQSVSDAADTIENADLTMQVDELTSALEAAGKSDVLQIPVQYRAFVAYKGKNLSI